MLIDEYSQHLPIKRMCELLNISRDAYYNWNLSKDLPKTDSNDFALVKQIEEVVLEFPGYGYRRVTAQLKREDKQVNHKKILRIMRENNLTMKKKCRHFRTTDSSHGLPIYPNLAKEIILSGINQLWVADITYIRLKLMFVYLAAILDAFSRKVVGWALRDSLDKDLSLSALRMALARRDFGPGLIHHSDRGVQYACKEYVALLKSRGIAISMTSTGNPYENAQAESFIATLKREEVYLYEYDDIMEALLRIGYFIEDVYNTKRLHSSLGYLPPAEFERDLVTVKLS
jgi:transposase InsO family protein